MLHSFMYYFSRLERIAHYKSKNQNVMKRNFRSRAHTHTHTHTHTLHTLNTHTQ